MAIKKIAFPSSLVSLKRLSQSFYVIILPAIIASFNTEPSHVKKLLSIFFFGLIVSVILLGPLTDIISQKKTGLFLLATYIAGSLICAFGSSIWLLWIGIFIIGIGLGTLSNMGYAIVASLYEEEQKKATAFANLGLIATWVPAIGTSIGGHVTHYFGWRYVFFISAAMGLFMFVLLLKAKLKEKKQKNPLSLKKQFTNYYTVLSCKNFMPFLIYSIIPYASFILGLTGLTSIFHHTLKISTNITGYLFFILIISNITAIQISKMLTKVLNAQTILAYSNFFALLSSFVMIYCAIYLQPSLYSLGLPFLAFHFSNCIKRPHESAIIYLPAPTELANTVSTLSTLLNATGCSLLLWAASYCSSNSFALDALIISILAVITLVLFFVSVCKARCLDTKKIKKNKI